MSARRYKAHPQSAAGDFYVVDNECVSCGAPHAVAPDLIGWAEPVGDFSHCIWKRQPRTGDEIEQAIGAVLVSAGDDQKVIERLGPGYCDAARLSRPEPVNRNPPSPPTFALIAAGRSPLYRMIAALKSMRSWLSHKV